MALWGLKHLSGEVSKVAIKAETKREENIGQAMSLYSPKAGNQCGPASSETVAYGAYGPRALEALGSSLLAS